MKSARIYKAIFLLLFAFMSKFSFAVGQCVPISGFHNSTYNWGVYNIPATSNIVGGQFPGTTITTAGGDVTLNCSCSGGPYKNAEVWGDSELPSAGIYNNLNYYDIPGNDYLQVATQVYTEKQGYVNVPFGPISNVTIGTSDTYSCNTPFGLTTGGEHTGSAIKISLRIKKPFIGTVFLPPTEVARMFWTLGPTSEHGSQPTNNVYLTGTVVVPQSCSIEPGSVFEIDLGQIAQKNFISGGAGNRPLGYINRPLTVKLRCAGGVQQDAQLTMRLEGSASQNYSNALATDNSKVGVIITKSDGVTPLIPNNSASVIPFQLTDGMGSTVIQAYPISLTGTAPDAGVFNSLSVLRFDFQ